MSHEVVIVGGGPNGLLMACELALGGVRPLVLEAEAQRPLVPKANGLVGRVVAALDYRGLYERITGDPAPPRQIGRFMFGGIGFDLAEQPDLGMYAAQIPQADLEELLRVRAAELGIEPLRGHRVTDVRQNADAVTLSVRGPDGAYERTAGYVVAADGGRSVVRKALGIGFPGVTDDSFVTRSAQVLIDPPVARPDRALDVPGVGVLPPGFNRTETGVFTYLPMPGGEYRIAVHTWGEPAQPDSEYLSIVELNEALHAVLGATIPMRYPDQPTLRRRNTGINSRQAERYRNGRVFLAGDAAHVHSGVGGPGLNLGMQDVLNLGWKLAAVLRGDAPQTLLDTYHAERFPVGERVMMHSRAQLALLAPGPNATALRELFGELLRDRPAVRRITELMSSAEIRYPMPGTHPLVGTWMPDLLLHNGSGATRVAELMRSARGLLLDLGTGEPGEESTVEGWADRVDVVCARTENPPAERILLRPDGFVAWAGGREDDGLREALRTWFGELAVVTVA